MLGLFPLFGIMLNGPISILLNLISIPLQNPWTKHVTISDLFFPFILNLVQVAFLYIHALLYIYRERERKRERVIYMHIRKGWVCVH